MKIEIIKSKRKTMSLQLSDSGNLVVRAPARMKDEKIMLFVQSKQAWIAKQLAQMQKKADFEQSFDFSNFVYILGEKQPLQEFDLGGNLGSKNPASPLVYDKFYKDQAKKFLPKRAEEISKAIGLGYGQFKLSRSQHYWGCYSKKGVLHLNFKLIVLPQTLIDYVIIHELCHGKHFNHSPQFWALVGTFYPHYKAARAELDDYGFLLKTKQ